MEKIKQIKATCRAKNLPNIYLLHGEFTDIEMNEIYNHSKIKAMVCLTKGEGFGRPLLEFSLVNKPILTTNWSGHIDFLNPEFTTLLPGQMTKVHPSAANKMLLKDSQWFNVDTIHVGHYLKDVFEDYKKYLNLAGIENKNFSGHSLRSGFATVAAESGADERSIMAMTGHKTTQMVRRYIREANIFKNNALNKVKI